MFQIPIAGVVGFFLLSVVVVGICAFAYRWYFGRRVPDGVAALVGVSAVVLVLNALALGVSLGTIISGQSTTNVFDVSNVLQNIVSLLAALAATPIGVRGGDVAAASLTGTGVGLDGELRTVVRSAGRVTPVKLPEEIEDMDDHDPVIDKTKAEIAGKTLLFPRRLTVDELRDRLVTRLKDDYGVGYVDVELDDDGKVEYLAVGSRLLGIGPTLAPGTAVIAVRADPANGASTGDLVQVWSDGDDPSRVLTAELRGTAGDVVTLAADEDEMKRLDPTTSYRLVTLPTDPRADREFASLLRTADETMGTVSVDEGSALAGATVGDVGATVAAIRPARGTVEAIPKRGRTLAPGDTLYVVARPEALRRLGGDGEAQSSSITGRE